MWQKILNTITDQTKDAGSNLSPLEWNQIINILKKQANNNTLGIIEITDILIPLIKRDIKGIEGIEDGTTVVKKAEQDENGNNIKDTYATVIYVDGKISGMDKFWVDEEPPTDPKYNFWIDTNTYLITPMTFISPDSNYIEENQGLYDKDGNYIGGLQ